jgi:hypothetical protein
VAPIVPPDPQSAIDYDDRTTAAVKAVLLEIGQILGSFHGKFAVSCSSRHQLGVRGGRRAVYDPDC